MCFTLNVELRKNLIPATLVIIERIVVTLLIDGNWKAALSKLISAESLMKKVSFVDGFTMKQKVGHKTAWNKMGRYPWWLDLPWLWQADFEMIEI